MAATTALHPHAIDDLATAYDFRDPDEVRRFLTSYPFLVPLLREARPIIAHHFGPATSVALELLYDRETEHEADTELFALIQTDLPPDEANPRLDRLRDAWWLDNFRRAKDRLEIGLWYV